MRIYIDALQSINWQGTRQSRNGTPLKMIAPSHGIIWRTHIQDILKKYEQWGSGYHDDSVVIVYDSMWGATEDMARRILEGVRDLAVLFAAGCDGRIALRDQPLDVQHRWLRPIETAFAGHR